MALYGSSNISATSPALTAVATTQKTFLQLSAATATLRRAFVYEFDMGAASVPNATDCEIVWSIIQQTSIGTGVTMTINKLDQADAAAGSVSLANFTAEPTGAETLVLWAMGANQRASYRWVVAPGGPGELVVPATNLNGLGLRAKSSTYTGNVNATMLWRE
jgi:hypothetical protein